MARKTNCCHLSFTPMPHLYVPREDLLIASSIPKKTHADINCFLLCMSTAIRSHIFVKCDTLMNKGPPHLYVPRQCLLIAPLHRVEGARSKGRCNRRCHLHLLRQLGAQRALQWGRIISELLQNSQECEIM